MSTQAGLSPLLIYLSFCRICCAPAHLLLLTVQKLWPINKIFLRTDNSTVKNQGLPFLFIAHGLDEIHLSLKLHKSIPSGCRVMALHS